MKKVRIFTVLCLKTNSVKQVQHFLFHAYFEMCCGFLSGEPKMTLREV